MLTYTNVLIIKNPLTIENPEPILPENYTPMNAEDTFSIQLVGGDAESPGTLVVGGQGANI